MNREEKAFIADAKAKFGIRRYHTDQTRLCENCQATGSPDKRLLRCKGCENSWYCGTACQKVHWKIHKSNCKRQQEGYANQDVGAGVVRTAMSEWVRQKDLALGFAANEALLPARDRPDHNLSETHVLMVNLNEFPRGSGEFEIVGVRVALHEEMRNAFKELGSESEYHDLIAKLKVMKEGAERQLGGVKIWGTTFIVVRCIVGLEMIMQVHPNFIKQEAIVEKMKEDARTNWIEQFKIFAATRKMYQTPDGQIFAIASAKNAQSIK